jgi:hypothetical protein
VKAAAVVLSVAVAGVALAAGTGVLPNPLGPADAPPGLNSATPATPPGPPWSSNADRRSSTPPGSSSDSGTSAGTSAPPGASASPDHASLVGLCRAYQAHGDRDPGAALGSAAFAGLVAAAGGVDQVPALCAELLAAEEQSGNRDGSGGGDGTGSGDGSGTGTGAATAPTADRGAGQTAGQGTGQGQPLAPDELIVE